MFPVVIRDRIDLHSKTFSNSLLANIWGLFYSLLKQLIVECSYIWFFFCPTWDFFILSVCRGWDSSTQPYAYKAKALPDCTTSETFSFPTTVTAGIFTTNPIHGERSNRLWNRRGRQVMRRCSKTYKLNHNGYDAFYRILTCSAHTKEASMLNGHNGLAFAALYHKWWRLDLSEQFLDENLKKYPN